MCIRDRVNGSVVAQIPIVSAEAAVPADTRSGFQKWLDRLRRPA